MKMNRAKYGQLLKSSKVVDACDLVVGDIVKEGTIATTIERVISHSQGVMIYGKFTFGTMKNTIFFGPFEAVEVFQRSMNINEAINLKTWCGVENDGAMVSRNFRDRFDRAQLKMVISQPCR